jgi:hypothetical protein
MLKAPQLGLGFWDRGSFTGSYVLTSFVAWLIISAPTRETPLTLFTRLPHTHIISIITTFPLWHECCLPLAQAILIRTQDGARVILNTHQTH